MATTDGNAIGARAARRLRDADCCAIAPGLTGAEFARVERDHGIEFADDHRAFLAAGLPVNTRPPVPGAPGVVRASTEPWPDWRDGDPAVLRDRLAWPVDGVLFDVGHGLWLPAWGDRPPTTAAAVATARGLLAHVPAMIPVYAHRYLPGGHGTSGHPVLSMWQTDIVCYGADLADYIAREFATTPRPHDASPLPHPTVPFWTDLL